MTTQIERLTSVETRLEALETKVDKMSDKLDDLLALKNKGTGAFWLASMIVGTGVTGFILQIISWFRS